MKIANAKETCVVSHADLSQAQFTVANFSDVGITDGVLVGDLLKADRSRA